LVKLEIKTSLIYILSWKNEMKKAAYVHFLSGCSSRADSGRYAERVRKDISEG
jgi:predicted DsbA family dithiol-disulfide isomerase